MRKERSYFLTDPSGLEQILIKDVLEHTGTTAVEKSITAAVAKHSPILEGVPMEQPRIEGYVKFVAKPGADTILTVDVKKEPLLTLGRQDSADPPCSLRMRRAAGPRSGSPGTASTGSG